MSKIILICRDVLGNKMAGPAIRYFEFAKALSKHYKVLLLVDHPTSLKHENFEIELSTSEVLRNEVPKAKAVIAQDFSLLLTFLAKRHHVSLILDLYAPEPLEHLEIFKHEDPFLQEARKERVIKKISYSVKLADFILAANTRQRDLWLGFQMALNKMSVRNYLQDPSFQNSFGIVPFGLSSTPPIKTGPGLKEKLGLKSNSKLLIWGGGVWNWFDPLTLIRAVDLLHQEGVDIHLLFLGVQHPNPAIPTMKMCHTAVSLAKELKLLDTVVHFNFDWVPYDERQNTLLEADIGVSTHFDHLETRFSFRTRLLDYLWAGLPMVTTEGDCFEEEIKKHHLGLTVPPEDPIALKNALKILLNEAEEREKIKENIASYKKKLHWDEVIKPIIHFLSLEKIEQSQREKSSQNIMILREFLKDKGPIEFVKYGITRSYLKLLSRFS